jgi:hypothetical protein
VLFGTLEGVGDGFVNVIGQQLSLKNLDIDQAALLLHVGKLVYVEAQTVEGGLAVTNLDTFDSFGVPGASTVVVQGTVNAVDSSTGRVSVGNLDIDVNTIRGLSPELGQVITIVGTQPVPQGLILGSARK